MRTYLSSSGSGDVHRVGRPSQHEKGNVFLALVARPSGGLLSPELLQLFVVESIRVNGPSCPFLSVGSRGFQCRNVGRRAASGQLDRLELSSISRRISRLVVAS